MARAIVDSAGMAMGFWASSMVTVYSNDGVSLTLSDVVRPDTFPNSESFLVTVQCEGLTAAARVEAEMYPHLGSYFDELADDWGGWQGPKVWRSTKEEFTLSAVCDRTGHVTLSYVLRPTHGAFFWELSGTLALEAGQLESIAQAVGKLWENSAR